MAMSVAAIMSIMLCRVYARCSRDMLERRLCRARILKSVAAWWFSSGDLLL